MTRLHSELFGLNSNPLRELKTRYCRLLLYKMIFIEKQLDGEFIEKNEGRDKWQKNYENLKSEISLIIGVSYNDVY